MKVRRVYSPRRFEGLGVGLILFLPASANRVDQIGETPDGSSWNGVFSEVGYRHEISARWTLGELNEQVWIETGVRCGSGGRDRSCRCWQRVVTIGADGKRQLHGDEFVWGGYYSGYVELHAEHHLLPAGKHRQRRHGDVQRISSFERSAMFGQLSERRERLSVRLAVSVPGAIRTIPGRPRVGLRL